MLLICRCALCSYSSSVLNPFTVRALWQSTCPGESARTLTHTRTPSHTLTHLCYYRTSAPCPPTPAHVTMQPHLHFLICAVSCVRACHHAHERALLQKTHTHTHIQAENVNILQTGQNKWPLCPADSHRQMYNTILRASPAWYCAFRVTLSCCFSEGWGLCTQWQFILS